MHRTKNGTVFDQSRTCFLAQSVTAPEEEVVAIPIWLLFRRSPSSVIEYLP